MSESSQIDRHNLEVYSNKENWDNKPIIRKVYDKFYDLIAKHLTNIPGQTLELGSGMGNIKKKIPDCITSDLFSYPWLDRQEDAYNLSFDDHSISNLIIFDVWHHLQYPGLALSEFDRVLCEKGRIIIFEPGMGLLGKFIYKNFHDEPVAIKEKINWDIPEKFKSEECDYYAAQGNAHRVFLEGENHEQLINWNTLAIKRFSSLSYVLSGGFSKPQLYPDSFYPIIFFLEKLCDFIPHIFTTRMLIVLEKRNDLSIN